MQKCYSIGANTTSVEITNMTYQKPPLELDHLAVIAPSLDEGFDYVKSELGVEVPLGGAHPKMGTHNRLMRLGENAYFEIIAIDPDAPLPETPRWFGLSKPPRRPRLGAWILRTNHIKESLAQMPLAGEPIEMSRGDLNWKISYASGALPMEGAFPLLIEWVNGTSPAKKMVDRGCALEKLVVSHPEIDVVKSALEGVMDDERIEFEYSDAPKIQAEISTPFGSKTID